MDIIHHANIIVTSEWLDHDSKTFVVVPYYGND